MGPSAGSKASAEPPSDKPSRMMTLDTPDCSKPAMALSRAPARGPVTSQVGTGALVAMAPAACETVTGSDALLCQLARLDAQLLELAVQVGTFEAGFFRHARHAAAFAAQVVLEIHALKSVARLAQRQVE